MNAVERLEAAITKLEGLRGVRPENGDREWTHRGRTILAFDGTPVAKDVISMDRDLIVTLHRTIDAQLALLRWAFELYALPNASHPNPLETRALSLADAILGGES